MKTRGNNYEEMQAEKEADEQRWNKYVIKLQTTIWGISECNGWSHQEKVTASILALGCKAVDTRSTFPYN